MPGLQQGGHSTAGALEYRGVSRDLPETDSESSQGGSPVGVWKSSFFCCFHPQRWLVSPLPALRSCVVRAAYRVEMLRGTDRDPLFSFPIPAERREVLSGLGHEGFSPRAPGFQLLPRSAMRKLSPTDGSLPR